MVRRPDITRCLEAGMKAASLRRAVIANNIANVNTPGYRRKAVEFEKFMAEAIASGEEVKAELGFLRRNQQAFSFINEINDIKRTI